MLVKNKIKISQPFVENLFFFFFLLGWMDGTFLATANFRRCKGPYLSPRKTGQPTRHPNSRSVCQHCPDSDSLSLCVCVFFVFYFSLLFFNCGGIKKVYMGHSLIFQLSFLFFLFS